MHRSGRIARFGVLAAAVAAVSFAGPTGAAGPSAATQPAVADEDDENLPPGLRGHSFVTSDERGHIVVDTTKAPQGFAALLDSNESDLDGRVVILQGHEASEPSTRRREDKDRSRSDRAAVADDKCLALPSVTGRGISPYLGCTPQSGHAFQTESGTSVGSEPTMSEALADTVLAANAEAPDPSAVRAETIAPRTAMQGQVLTVDFPAAFANLDNFASSGGGGELWRRLAVTAMTDDQVEGVDFRLDGDCEAFAYATGGDACAGVVTRSELEGEVVK